MQLYCRQCSAEIQANDVNLDKMIAKCSTCNAVFSFADMYDGEHSHQKKKKALQYDIPMPDKVTMQDNGHTLTIERKWFDWSSLILGGFAIFWNGFIWTNFVPLSSSDPDFPILFLLPFIGVGLFLAYSSIAGVINTTRIEVKNKQLTISHFPLPYPGNNISEGEIEQLFAKKRTARTKNGTRTYYQLCVLLNNGREKTLLNNMTSPDQSLFVEQEVERFLYIEDIPVGGGYKP